MFPSRTNIGSSTYVGSQQLLKVEVNAIKLGTLLDFQQRGFPLTQQRNSVPSLFGVA